jgi:hypothetical protein
LTNICFILLIDGGNQWIEKSKIFLSACVGWTDVLLGYFF